MYFCLLAGVSLRGQDNVAAINYLGKLTVFSRSLTKTSHLYWTQENANSWMDWAVIGGTSVALKTDVAVAYNGFSKVFCNLYRLRAYSFGPIPE